MDNKRNIQYSTYGFENREGRYDFLLKNFGDIIKNSASVLDVGCDYNHLKKIIGNKVFGIDIAGAPDKIVDLEKEALRSFKDNSFETIICTEVLEHIDNLHEVAHELVRVASKRVIISLPNSASYPRLWKIIKSKKTGKFYGLPYQKPVDRHKWYFSAKEILGFMEALSLEHNVEIEKVILRYNCQFPHATRLISKIKQGLFAVFLKTTKITNMAQDVFVVLKKHE